MALPQIEEKLYEMNLVSNSKKKINFSTLKIGQQKDVMVIRESSKNEFDIIKSIVKMVEGCIDKEKVNINDLYIVDFTKLFYSIRSFSEGNEIKFEKNCKNGHENKITLNVAQDFSIINNNNFTKKIKIPNSKIMFEVRQYKLKDILNLNDLDELSDEEKIFNLLAYTVTKIYNEDQIFYNTHDHNNKGNTFTIEECKQWIEKLPSPILDDLKKFYKNVPQMKLDKEFHCEKCGEKLNIQEGGFGNFL